MFVALNRIIKNEQKSAAMAHLNASIVVTEEIWLESLFYMHESRVNVVAICMCSALSHAHNAQKNNKLFNKYSITDFVIYLIVFIIIIYWPAILIVHV